MQVHIDEQKILSLVRLLPRAVISVDALMDRNRLLLQILQLADPLVQACCSCGVGLPLFAIPCSNNKKFACALCALSGGCPAACAPNRVPSCQFQRSITNFLSVNPTDRAVKVCRSLSSKQDTRFHATSCATCKKTPVTWFFAEMICNGCFQKKAADERKRRRPPSSVSPTRRTKPRPEALEENTAAGNQMETGVVEKILATPILSHLQRNASAGCDVAALLHIEDHLRDAPLAQQFATIVSFHSATQNAAFIQKVVTSKLIEVHHSEFAGVGWETEVKKVCSEQFKLLQLAKALKNHPGIAYIDISRHPWRSWRNKIVELDHALTVLARADSEQYVLRWKVK